MAKKKSTAKKRKRTTKKRARPGAEAKKDEQLYGANVEIQTVLVDSVRFTLRRDPPSMILSFFQSIPGIEPQHRFEVFRAITSLDHAKQIVEIMGKTLDQTRGGETREGEA